MPKTFPQSIEISDIDGRSRETIDALVNAGAFFTAIPADTLARLGITPFDKRAFILPDGSRAERKIGYALAKINGREVRTIVTFGDEGAQPLLGKYTLEGLGLEVDEPNARLVKTPYLFAPSLIAAERCD